MLFLCVNGAHYTLSFSLFLFSGRIIVGVVVVYCILACGMTFVGVSLTSLKEWLEEGGRDAASSHVDCPLFCV